MPSHVSHLRSAPPPRTIFVSALRSCCCIFFLFRFACLPVLCPLTQFLQSIGSRVSSWFRGKKSSEEGSPPPKTIAGLYLRETHNHRLALMMKNKADGATDSSKGGAVIPAEEDGGHANGNGGDGGDGAKESDGGGGGGPRIVETRGGGRDSVEFGVVLEGDSVSGMEKAAVSAVDVAQATVAFGGKAGADLGGEAEIEMRETEPDGGE